MGYPVRVALVPVRELEPELRSVAEQLDDVANAPPAEHDHHLAHAHVAQCLEGIEDHRPIKDRQQVLVRDARQRVETHPAATGEDEALHRAEYRPGSCAACRRAIDRAMPTAPKSR